MAAVKQVKKFSEIEPVKENPFLSALNTSMNIRTRKGTITTKDYYDTSTGKMVPATLIADVKEVEIEAFVKVYSDRIADWAGLSSSANKVFSYILIKLRKQSDEVYIYIPEVQEACGWGESNMVYKGLLELYNAGIITRSATRPHIWFINPAYAFNGNRLYFLKMIKLKGTEASADDIDFEEFPQRALSALLQIPATDDYTPEQIEHFKELERQEESMEEPICFANEQAMQETITPLGKYIRHSSKF